jgi:hypothetical protein
MSGFSNNVGWARRVSAVTRRRAASGSIAFQASPQAIQQEQVGWQVMALRLQIHE